MSEKNNEQTHQTISDEFKDQSSKLNLSKFDCELYKEEDDISFKVIRVKHFSLPNKGSRWKILEDTKVGFVIEGSKLSKKEREFLKTVDGVNFLISQYKIGIKAFSALKIEIKKVLK